jgi:hypothetical protein
MAVEINMKMPQNCFVCPVRNTSKEGKKVSSYCGINEKTIHNTSKRASTCPLKEKK